MKDYNPEEPFVTCQVKLPTIRIYKLRYPGSSGSRYCAYQENGLDGLLDDLKNADVGCTAEIEICEMLQAEFDELPEFDGF